MDFRKIVVVFIIAVLYLVFVLSLSNAVFDRPQYSDYCKSQKAVPLSISSNCTAKIPGLNNKTQSCIETGGIITNVYDDSGCVKDIKCDYCNKEYKKHYEAFNFKNFLLGSFMGLLVIAFALFLPTKKNELHKWSATGFLLGGLLVIFTTTAQYYSQLHKALRPIVIFAELVLVIYLFYTQMSSEKGK